MRAIIFTLLLFFGASCVLHAREQPDSLVIRKLKAGYRIGEPIRFEIRNAGGRNLFVSFKLLQYLRAEKDWDVRVADLFNYTCDNRKKLGVTLVLLKSGASMQVAWYPKKANQKTCFNWKAGAGLYRIAVGYYGQSGDESGAETYTDRFVVK